MPKKIYQKPRGMQDILQKKQPNWWYVCDVFSQVCLNSGYQRVMTPILEDSRLFTRGVGVDTEIVEKEMYSFKDKSGNSLSLRPEATAPIVRAYLENGMSSWPKPVKLYMVNEPMFRYDRPQTGRYRQFYQLGVEVFGNSDATIDASIIALATRFYRNLGIKFSLQINSIGDLQTRKKYKKELIKYFKPLSSKLDQTAKKQLKNNPLRLLDSKDKKVVKLCENAPQLIDFLDKKSRQHFQSVLECLDQLDIEYELNPKLVRGLDYYNQTVFEFWGSHQGMQNALGGGGRYDGLVELLGGKKTPAVGFGVGIERILAEMSKTNKLALSDNPFIYVAFLGEEAKSQAYSLVEKLLDEGISTRNDFHKKSITEQLSRASKLKASYCMIIGKKEIIDSEVIVKELTSGNQEVIPIDKAVAEMKRRFISK